MGVFWIQRESPITLEKHAAWLKEFSYLRCGADQPKPSWTLFVYLVTFISDETLWSGWIVPVG